MLSVAVKCAESNDSGPGSPGVARNTGAVAAGFTQVSWYVYCPAALIVKSLNATDLSARCPSSDRRSKV
jgi:hypothetical protein